MQEDRKKVVDDLYKRAFENTVDLIISSSSSADLIANDERDMVRRDVESIVENMVNKGFLEPRTVNTKVILTPSLKLVHGIAHLIDHQVMVSINSNMATAGRSGATQQGASGNTSRGIIRVETDQESFRSFLRMAVGWVSILAYAQDLDTLMWVVEFDKEHRFIKKITTRDGNYHAHEISKPTVRAIDMVAEYIYGMIESSRKVFDTLWGYFKVRATEIVRLNHEGAEHILRRELIHTIDVVNSYFS